MEPMLSLGLICAVLCGWYGLRKWYEYSKQKQRDEAAEWRYSMSKNDYGSYSKLYNTGYVRPTTPVKVTEPAPHSRSLDIVTGALIGAGLDRMLSPHESRSYTPPEPSQEAPSRDGDYGGGGSSGGWDSSSSSSDSSSSDSSSSSSDD